MVATTGFQNTLLMHLFLKKKRVDRNGSVTTITFLSVRAQRIPREFRTLTRFLFQRRAYCFLNERIMLHGRVTLLYSSINV